MTVKRLKNRWLRIYPPSADKKSLIIRQTRVICVLKIVFLSIS